MRLLHEDEFEFVLSLLEHKGQTIDLNTSDEQRSYLDMYTIPEFLKRLKNAGVIEIEAAWIDQAGYFYDTLLHEYYRLANEKNDIAAAKALASHFTIGEALNKTLVPQKSLEETLAIIDEIAENVEAFHEASIAEDLYDVLDVRVHVKNDLEEYRVAYLQAFKNDELEKPKPSTPTDFCIIP